MLDVVFDEDGSRVRTDHGPDNFGLIRRMAISMLKAEESLSSIQVKRLKAGWDNGFMEKIVRDFKEN